MSFHLMSSVQGGPVPGRGTETPQLAQLSRIKAELTSTIGVVKQVQGISTPTYFAQAVRKANHLSFGWYS